MNTKLEYLYRDADNNKKWGEVVFTNHNNIDLNQIESMLKKALIQNEFFIASKSGLPELSFQKPDKEIDHGWYEYSEINNTTEQDNDLYNRDITDLIKLLMHTSNIENRTGSY